MLVSLSRAHEESSTFTKTSGVSSLCPEVARELVDARASTSAQRSTFVGLFARRAGVSLGFAGLAARFFGGAFTFGVAFAFGCSSASRKAHHARQPCLHFFALRHSPSESPATTLRDRVPRLQAQRRRKERRAASFRPRQSSSRRGRDEDHRRKGPSRREPPSLYLARLLAKSTRARRASGLFSPRRRISPAGIPPSRVWSGRFSSGSGSSSR